MKKIIVFTSAEDEIEEILTDEGYDFYDLANSNPEDEDAITYFETTHPELCDIVELPEDATDYKIIHYEDGIQIIIVQNGKIKTIYDSEYF